MAKAVFETRVNETVFATSKMSLLAPILRWMPAPITMTRTLSVRILKRIIGWVVLKSSCDGKYCVVI